ncbi:nitrogenase-stabilizing/protective protein [Azorhizobium caulinodans ORS 571]|uniref:Nitrogenase-stabilizing/protective protein NifW n=1 Tax=Azorhizobium caulinodans (strain ATCC 43989 / DSM 5975 / JCM 20966 / LMG 6465 / NBRC 14845 / NCIMB 13405 / ORS 571) TaxID=438753 RepID=NIFW_AZOC5|nr:MULTISPECIES: nitrogenase stabilizing/protective protein NifW [Azorhizobium]P26481.1 RecName: Full=Nitrogenase-stabilizing/protective protein NifW [Azorhizobium caulinodans ORS 571]AAA26188.1 nitrogen fixation protein (nifO) [Azorhizobium caulinodans]TDU01226.1 nitrogenase-stabilizing/protective protein [Azorhizobium sp. AG788]BAF89444.1 nitrogenase-stabilizing/protective protein [Azorhizobium caulinodans ORS 571]
MATAGGILDQLNKASSAEDFFALLEVDYDPQVVNVVRLHILRRMGQYLVSENFEGQADDAIRARCKEVLEQAYADFLASSPLQERVFKVLKEAAQPPKPKPMVSLTVLK